jgi:hypothetical protein
MAHFPLIFYIVGVVLSTLLCSSCKEGNKTSSNAGSETAASTSTTSHLNSLDQKTTFWSGKVGGRTLKLYLSVNDTIVEGQAYFASGQYKPLKGFGAIRKDSIVIGLSDFMYSSTPSDVDNGGLSLKLSANQLVGKWKGASDKSVVGVQFKRMDMGYTINHSLLVYAIAKENVDLDYFIPRLEMKGNPSIEKAFYNQLALPFEQDFQSKKESAQIWLKKQAEQRNTTSDTMKSAFGSECDYKVIFATPSVLSIEQRGIVYTNRDNGLPWFLTHTFDMRSGKVIELAELFKDGFDYRSFIWNYCRKELQSNYGLLQPGDRLDKQPKAFDCFYFTSNALVIQFKALEVSPDFYGFGMPNVAIPFSALMPHLNPLNDLIQTIERER